MNLKALQGDPRYTQYLPRDLNEFDLVLHEDGETVVLRNVSVSLEYSMSLTRSYAVRFRLLVRTSEAHTSWHDAPADGAAKALMITFKEMLNSKKLSDISEANRVANDILG